MDPSHNLGGSEALADGREWIGSPEAIRVFRPHAARVTPSRFIEQPSGEPGAPDDRLFAPGSYVG